jgi:hypothetical protein
MTAHSEHDDAAANNSATTDATSRPALWTTSGLATAVGYHPESIRRAIRQGRIRTVRFGRGHRISDAEAQRILKEGLPA